GERSPGAGGSPEKPEETAETTPIKRKGFMAKDDLPIKPYLKWAGGKRQLLAAIKGCLPRDVRHYTYYEPFVGAGAVFFELRPGKAVINDCNAQLILTYAVIKDHVEELIALLKRHKEKNDRAYFYEIRNLDREEKKFDELTDAEKAARLIFLNKTCFNGLYRVNSRGLFNVPYGRYKNPRICEEALLRRINEYLNAGEIVILNGDFEQAVATAGEAAFIYFDPPYHSPNKTNFTGYQADGFDEGEQERLRNVMIEMTGRGSKCLLSNFDTEYIRNLYNYDCFDILSVQAKRPINSNSEGRGKVNEVLIKNWKN
ncbi:MAG: DNA adenine methylase, partial [Treponema sp.]|nr:DNA adenine methylase [Treponema sp.]